MNSILAKLSFYIEKVISFNNIKYIFQKINSFLTFSVLCLKEAEIWDEIILPENKNLTC